MTTDWREAPTEALLETLWTCGLAVPPGLPEEIVRRGVETREPLCAFTADPASWEATEGPAMWTPILVIHLLGAIGDPRSAPVLLSALRERNLGDFLHDGMPGVLAWLGPEVSEPLEAAARDPSLNEYQRAAAVRALYGVGCRAPEVRADIAVRLSRIVEESQDATLLGFAASVVACVDDPVAQRALDAAFAEGRVDESIIGLDDVELIRGETPWMLDRGTSDPMAFFGEESLEDLRALERDRARWRAEAAEREARKARRVALLEAHPALARALPQPVVGSFGTVRRAGAKVGRNDPCPCGSGKKYKKCCLGVL